MINETKLAQLIVAYRALKEAQLEYDSAVLQIAHNVQNEYAKTFKPYLLSVGGQQYSITIKVNTPEYGVAPTVEPEIYRLFDVNDKETQHNGNNTDNV